MQARASFGGALTLGALALASCHGADVVEGVLLTYYWIPWESEFSCAQKDTALQTCAGATLATVCLAFAQSARMEGTATLDTGELVNLDCDCGSGFACFVILDPTRYPWGMGSNGNALQPYVSVASNDPRWPYGTWLDLEELHGLALPDSTLTHDGCVRVDDVGWSFGKNQLDFFVGRQASYLAIDGQLAMEEVTVTERPSCRPRDY
jgi:hypothetical protein